MSFFNLRTQMSSLIFFLVSSRCNRMAFFSSSGCFICLRASSWGTTTTLSNDSEHHLFAKYCTRAQLCWILLAPWRVCVSSVSRVWKARLSFVRGHWFVFSFLEFRSPLHLRKLFFLSQLWLVTLPKHEKPSRQDVFGAGWFAAEGPPICKKSLAANLTTICFKRLTFLYKISQFNDIFDLNLLQCNYVQLYTFSCVANIYCMKLFCLSAVCKLCVQNVLLNSSMIESISKSLSVGLWLSCMIEIPKTRKRRVET